MPSCIYLLTNTITQKQYVGFSTNYDNRMYYYSCMSNNNTDDRYIARSIRNHGWVNFTSEIIYMSLDANHCLNVMEGIFIAKFNTFSCGYNCTLGGDGAIGRKHSEETKRKMRINMKGKHLGRKHINRKMSESARLSMVGRKRSSETIEKMRRASTKFIIPPKNHLIDLLCHLFQRQIAEYYGTTQPTISNWKKEYNI